MSEVLFFNAKTAEMRFVNPHKYQEVENMKADGWMQNPTMIHMHNPSLNAHVSRPVQERKIWEERGYYAEPTFIYHPEEGTKMVSLDDAKKAYKMGWYASPAHFPGNDIGVLKTRVSKEAS